MAEQELEQAPEPTLDVEATVADIAESLHLADAEPEKDEGQASQGEAGGEEPKEAPAKVAPEEGTPPPAEGTPAASAPAAGEWQPSTWRKEAQAAWAALPPAVKAEVQKRESDIADYVSKTNVSVKVAQGFEKIIEPYVELYAKNGVNPWNHMRDLLGAHHTMLFGSPEQKTAMFTEIARSAGIDLAALAAGQPQGPNPYLNEVRQLRAQISRLEQGVGNVTSTVQEARVNELTEKVAEFALDPKHPFFDEVAADIKAIIDSKGAKTLEEAYEKAIWQNPQVRAKLVDQQYAERQKAEEEKNAKHVGRAQRALGGMPKSSGKGRATSPPETVDDTLWKTLKEINSRQ